MRLALPLVASLALPILAWFWLTPPARVSCGCTAKDCVVPCSTCCGDGGMAACLGPKDPTAHRCGH